MNYATYYRYDSFTAWRFSSLRSGQPAASDRSPTGGKHTRSQSGQLSNTPVGPSARERTRRPPRKPEYELVRLCSAAV
ncbi:hypothetical protein J2Y86_000982 [Pseudomonas migulae]|nr:hypothetical protein [Pseudomonas migulae]